MGTITIGLGGGTANTTGTQYRYWSYAGQGWREGIRGGNFVRDKTLTATGWDGIEDLDWENILDES